MQLRAEGVENLHPETGVTCRVEVLGKADAVVLEQERDRAVLLIAARDLDECRDAGRMGVFDRIGEQLRADEPERKRLVGRDRELVRAFDRDPQAVLIRRDRHHRRADVAEEPAERNACGVGARQEAMQPRDGVDAARHIEQNLANFVDLGIRGFQANQAADHGQAVADAVVFLGRG